MSDYIIGDIQGCYIHLKELLNKIKFSTDKDRLFFLGDIVNRGTDSLMTLRYIKDLGSNAEMVLGNHDFHLITCALTSKSPSNKDTFGEILAARDRNELIDFLLQQPLVIDHKDAILVHAGIPPIWDKGMSIRQSMKVQERLQSSNLGEFLTLMYNDNPKTWSENLSDKDDSRYTINAFMRMRFCKQDGTLEFKHKGNYSSAPDGFKAWFLHRSRITNGDNIFFGHWSKLDGVKHPNVFPLDYGCVWGEKLSAIRLKDKALFSVRCQ